MDIKNVDEFVRRATKDPKSVEATVMKQLAQEAATAAQTSLRELLNEMIRLVPGQLFKDIGAFHKKFGLEATSDPGHKLPLDVLRFRIRFMLEELQEYCAACNLRIVARDGELVVDGEGDEFVPESAFDGLIDLVYVALGTAFLHRFPFNEGWERVQAANMAKERATHADDSRSRRKHSADIVKPEGWKPPVLVDLLDEPCTACCGAGVRPQIGSEDVEIEPCYPCQGSGRRRRAATP